MTASAALSADGPPVRYRSLLLVHRHSRLEQLHATDAQDNETEAVVKA
jgi:hypothetical protein